MTQPTALGVLTTASVLTCGHTPPGTLVLTSKQKLAISGAAVLTTTSLGAIGSGCTPKKQGDSPCTQVVKITTGTASKLRVGQEAVLLSSLVGVTNGLITDPGPPPTTGPGHLKVVKVQGKLTAL